MNLSAHDPGSPEAFDEGCTCPPQNGPGAAMTSQAQPAYLCDTQCPLHGIDAAEAAFATGETWLIGKPANDNDQRPP